MRMNFTLSGTMDVPDYAIKHYDAAGELYALEFNNKIFLLQSCIVAESSSGDFEIIHGFKDLEDEGFKNIRYDVASFSE